MNFKLYIKESLKYILRSPYVIGRYIKEVDDLYNMSPAELKIYKEKRFLEIFRKAWTKSAYYRNLCIQNGVSSLDDIRRLEDIVKLPIMTKDMLKAHGEELLTRGKRGLIKNHTSGTTGTPLMVYENWPALWREQAYLYCYRKRCGFTYGEPLVSLRGNLTRRDTSLNVHVSNTLFLSSYNINSRTAETYHRLIEQHHPKAIEGYPSSLYSLALVFRDKGLECDIPVTFTSSETIYGYQREVIESVFHTKIYDHYGTTERTISIEESFDHDGYFESPGYGIEEYRDDCIITTSLINEAFPLIRYITNDRIILKDDVRKSAEGFIVDNGIKNLDGRAIAYLVGKDGTKYSDVALTFIFKETPGVRFAQFVQKRIGMVDLNIVTDDSFSENSEESVLNLIEEKVGLNNLQVTIHLIKEENLIKTPRGKLSLVINLINQK
jgi:phenylacetate-CoA ligase